MSVHKLPSGRWHARLKAGREYVGSRTFDTRRDAMAWLVRERAAMAGGIDPRAGRRLMRVVVEEWLAQREHTVSAKTYTADAALPRLMPKFLSAVQIGSVTDREVSRALVALNRSGLAESSVRRFRASLSAFFAWAVLERIVATNPVKTAPMPKTRVVRSEMRPFSEADLEAFHALAAEHDARLADVLLVAGWTGLRWSELREVRVRDFVEVPLPLLLVSRAAPEGVDVKTTKSGRRRSVPVSDRVLPIVRSLAADRRLDDLLFVTSSGHRLHASAVKRTVGWTEVSGGRRIHDLRHTAACLWLSRGVDAVTVQTWLGHASIATTNIYLHHLGTTADRAGLDRLNGLGHTWGTRRGTGAS